MWPHVASDTSYAELHEFARRLGVPGRGFDGDHYDLPAEHFDDAVATAGLRVGRGGRHPATGAPRLEP